MHRRWSALLREDAAMDDGAKDVVQVWEKVCRSLGHICAVEKGHEVDDVRYGNASYGTVVDAFLNHVGVCTQHRPRPRSLDDTRLCVHVVPVWYMYRHIKCSGTSCHWTPWRAKRHQTILSGHPICADKVVKQHVWASRPYTHGIDG